MGYPLFFRYTFPIAGDGFKAVVYTLGRCLVTNENARWSISGVEPGAVGAYGELPQSAIQNFREQFEKRLVNLASASSGIEDFRRQVEALFKRVDREEELRWEAARRDIREHRTPVEAPFSQLRRETADPTPDVVVVQWGDFDLAESKMNEEALPEAA
jgi:hypothetical protein